MRLEAIIMCYKPDKRLRSIITKLNTGTVAPDKIHIMLTEYAGYETDSNLITGWENVYTTLIKKEDFTHGGSRQLAADASKADYMLFMTQDAVPFDNTLAERLIDKLEKSTAAVAYARQIPYEDASETEKFARLYNYPSEDKSQYMPGDKKITARTIFNSDTCSMYKKSVFDELKGFSEVNFNEDAIYAYKAITAGYSIEYSSKAVVYHSHHYSYRQLFNRYRDNARNQRNTPEVYEKISNESEGFKFVKVAVFYFFRHKKFGAIISLLFESFIKYAAYFIGRYTDI